MLRSFIIGILLCFCNLYSNEQNIKEDESINLSSKSNNIELTDISNLYMEDLIETLNFEIMDYVIEKELFYEDELINHIKKYIPDFDVFYNTHSKLILSYYPTWVILGDVELTKKDINKYLEKVLDFRDFCNQLTSKNCDYSKMAFRREILLKILKILHYKKDYEKIEKLFLDKNFGFEAWKDKALYYLVEFSLRNYDSIKARMYADKMQFGNEHLKALNKIALYYGINNKNLDSILELYSPYKRLYELPNANFICNLLLGLYETSVTSSSCPLGTIFEAFIISGRDYEIYDLLENFSLKFQTNNLGISHPMLLEPIDNYLDFSLTNRYRMIFKEYLNFYELLYQHKLTEAEDIIYSEKNHFIYFKNYQLVLRLMNEYYKKGIIYEIERIMDGFELFKTAEFYPFIVYLYSKKQDFKNAERLFFDYEYYVENKSNYDDIQNPEISNKKDENEEDEEITKESIVHYKLLSALLICREKEKAGLTQ